VVAAAFDARPEIEYLPARQEVLHAWSNHEKARRLFRPGPEVPLDEGVARMAAWARRAGLRESRPIRDLEVRKNLPPSWNSLR